VALCCIYSIPHLPLTSGIEFSIAIATMCIKYRKRSRVFITKWSFYCFLTVHFLFFKTSHTGNTGNFSFSPRNTEYYTPVLFGGTGILDFYCTVLYIVLSLSLCVDGGSTAVHFVKTWKYSTRVFVYKRLRFRYFIHTVANGITVQFYTGYEGYSTQSTAERYGSGIL
jgi:hypothetical protein